MHIADLAEIKEDKEEFKWYVSGLISYMDQTVDLEWVRRVSVVQTTLMTAVMVISIAHMFRDTYWTRFYMCIAIILSICVLNMNYLNFPYEFWHYMMYNIPSLYFLYVASIWTTKASADFAS